MKKGTFFMVLAAAAGLASCAQGPKANLKTDVDTLSYMLGAANTRGLMDFVHGRLGIDSAHVADFIKGLEQGCKETDAKEKAYLAGIQIGQQISNDEMFDYTNKRIFGEDTTKTIDKDNFLAGFIATVKGHGMATADSANAYVEVKSEAIRVKALEEKFGEYKKQNEDFLASNKSKEGIQTTESGLQYKVIKMGNGEKPTEKSRVKMNYKGTLIDGTEFDSSKDKPATMSVRGVIKGWQEALKMMPVGSKWELYVPQELAYGTRQTGKIKPFSTLIFEVELVSIEK